MPHYNIVVGYLLFLMIVSIITRELLPAIHLHLTVLAIVGGWGAALLLVLRIRQLQRWLVGAMILVGLVCLVFVQQREHAAPWLAAISQSLPLLTMILSVGFMKRIALRAIAGEALLPTGFKAYRDTVFTVAVFGSFINISALIIVADRLSSHSPLNHHHVAAVTRAFSSCVCWSPFFAGIAVVISYSPAFSVSTVILQGIPIALTSIALILFLGWRQGDKLKNFQGFPAKWSSLWIPTLLAIVVIFLRYNFDHIALLPTIAVAALGVVVLVLLITDGVNGAAQVLHTHISEDLPRSANELTLLLGVGVLATGLVSWVNLGGIVWIPPDFTGRTAVVLLAMMIGIAMVGIHPVVSIALASSLLLPVNPNPEVLASTMLLGWSLGTLACPLSGTHLTVQGRYGMSSWRSATNQWPYVVLMFMLGAVWLQILAAWHIG